MSEVVALAIINVGVLWFLSLLAVHTDEEEHAPLKLFFILGSVWLAVSTLNLASRIAVEGSLASSIINSVNTNFWLIVVIASVTSFWFVVYYIQSVVTTINRLVHKRRNKQ